MFQEIADLYGYTFEFNITFIAPSRRRRRALSDSTDVQIDVKYSGPVDDDGDEDLATLEGQVGSDMTTLVDDEISTADGTLVDQTETSSVTASASVSTGEINCVGDETIEDSVTICSGDKQGISISVCALNQTRFVLGDLHMGDDIACVGRQRGDMYEFLIDSDHCNIIPSVNGSKLIYSSDVTGTTGLKDTIVSRQYNFVSTYFCDTNDI